jgi:hypothetical protein
LGSSNAAKITRALENQGIACHLVSSNNWRATSAAVEELRHQLKEAIREKDPTTIIFFLLDNSVFYGRQEDGSCAAPKKGSDGIYHVEGEVCTHCTCVEEILSSSTSTA